MNDTPLAFTIAEARDIASRPRFWVVLASVAAVLAIIGPFGTYGTLSLPARAAYWGVAAVGCFWVGFVTSVFVATQAEDWRIPAPLAQIVGGLVAGIPVALVVAMLNSIAFGEALLGSFVGILPYAAAIAVIIGIIYEVIEQREAKAAQRTAMRSDTDTIVAAPEADGNAAALMAKLPVTIGRDIVHLNAQDHYVAVRTTGGEALVLISMADAADALGARGMRVHRSWWVAHRHMRELVYRDGAPRLITSLGDEVPVGRSYRKGARAAVRNR